MVILYRTNRLCVLINGAQSGLREMVIGKWNEVIVKSEGMKKLR